MERKKVIKYFSIVLVCLSAIALISLNIYNRQQNKKIFQNGNHSISASAEPVDNAQSGSQNPDKNRTQNRFKDLNNQSTITEEDLNINDADSLWNLLASQQNKNINESSLVRWMRDQCYNQFSDLFIELNLPSEKQEKILDILIVKSKALSLVSDRWRDGIPSETEFKQLYQDTIRQYDQEVSQLLSEDDYEKYQYYMDTEDARYSVNRFINIPRSDEPLTENETSDEPLTEDNKEALIDAIYKETKEAGLEDWETEYYLLPSSFKNEENMDRTMKYFDRISEAYINASKNILSPLQAEQFEAIIKKNIETTVSQLREVALNSTDDKSK